MGEVKWTPAHAQAVAGMMLERDSVSGPVIEPISEWLVNEAKKLWPRRAGLRMFGRTNVRRAWTLATYHHPAQLCWSWALWLYLLPAGRSDRSSSFGFHRHDGNWALTVPFLFSLRFYRQRSDWMLSGDAKLRLQRKVTVTLARALAAAA